MGKNHCIGSCKFFIIYNNHNWLLFFFEVVLTGRGCYFNFDKFVKKNGMCSILEMEKFGQGERREAPPNNGIPKGDLFDFFEVLLVFIWGINWNLLSFFGVECITDRKNIYIAANTSLEKERKISRRRRILSVWIRISDRVFLSLDNK